MHNFKIVTTTEQLLLHIYEEQQKTNKLLKDLIEKSESQPEAMVQVAEQEEKPKRGRKSKEETPK